MALKQGFCKHLKGVILYRS